MLSPGRRLGQFEVLSALGQGGMGEVYRARDTKLRRDVALKALPAALAASPDRRARLEREARLLATLSHSGIATVYDLLDDEGRLVLVMELVEGETVEERLAQGPLSVRESLETARQVADALEAAHAKAIVHRDLKPSNVQLTADGRAKLLDFGLAKPLSSREEASSDVSTVATTAAELTGDHALVGTMPYMSPEQLRGEALDQRTDIWSFGCLLYEMLTGKRAFLGRTRADTIAAVLQQEPDWSALPRATPPRVRDVLHHCLQKDLGRRLHHVADARIELEEALTRLLSGQDDMATDGPSLAPRPRWRRWLGPVAAAVVVALLALAGAALWPRRPATRPPAPARVRVAVLAPHNGSADAATAGWPELTQALFVHELIGVEGLAVVDPLRLNGVLQEALGPGQPHGPALYAALRGEALAFVIEGSIAPLRSGYRLQWNVVEAASGIVRSSHDAVVTSEEQLGQAVAGAARQLLDFLEREWAPVAADKELRPWLTRGTNNVEAMKAFLTYSRYALRSEPGGAPYLDRAVTLDPTFVSARVWRIPSLVETGRIRQAQEDYRVLQQLALRASAFDQAMIDWVGAFLSGDPASEVRHLERALQYAPDNNILLVNLAESRLANADLPGAMKALEPALRIRWSYPALYTLQGAILVRQGRFAEAKGALREAAEMPVVDAGVYGMLSALCRRDREGAEADRYQALFAARSEQLGWDAAEQQDVLGGYLASVGLYGPAVHALRQAVALGPGSPARQVHLADALRQAGRPAEAAAACARALELDPQSPTAHLVLARVHEDRRQPVEALREYEAYLATGPKGASLRDVEARVAQLRRTQVPLPSRR